VCADDKLFLKSVYERQQDKPGIIQCYDPDEDEWKDKTQMPLEWMPLLRWCPIIEMRVFKGSKLAQSKFLEHEEDRPALSQSASLLGQSASSDKVCKCKCAIM